jgi:hypothetical protein
MHLQRNILALGLPVVGLALWGAAIPLAASGQSPAVPSPALPSPVVLSPGEPPSPTAVVSSEPPAVSPEQIQVWIEELDSDQYIRREAATRSLLLAGRPAIGALAAAADADRLESATRAVRVMLELSESGDEEQVMESLLALTSLENFPLEQKYAEQAIVRRRQDQALAEVIRLGAKVEESEIIVNGRPAMRQLKISDDWRGGVEGLGALRWIGSFNQLSFYGAPLTEEGLKYIAQMPLVSNPADGNGPRVEFFGTGLSEAAIDQFRRETGFNVDLRRSAKLGVRGVSEIGAAQILEVVEGSAAMKADLRPGDVIRELEGEQVKSFEQLTKMIGERRAGETVTMVVQRGEAILTTKVTFDQWR